LRAVSAAAGPILLVEDDPLAREALRLLLEDAGYAVDEAGTVAEAVDRAVARAPALVLLDLGLPDGPGLDVVAAFAGAPALRDVPIVALTGRAGTDERRRSLDAGCRAYLVKPVRVKDLLARIPAWTASATP
jgi:DNA-binding response OmpR family regulator